MKVGLEQATAEDRHRIAEITDCVARNRLFIASCSQSRASANRGLTYLDILPLLRARYHDLKAAQAVVQE